MTTASASSSPLPGVPEALLAALPAHLVTWPVLSFDDRRRTLSEEEDARLPLNCQCLRTPVSDSSQPTRVRASAGNVWVYDIQLPSGQWLGPVDEAVRVLGSKPNQAVRKVREDNRPPEIGAWNMTWPARWQNEREVRAALVWHVLHDHVERVLAPSAPVDDTALTWLAALAVEPDVAGRPRSEILAPLVAELLARSQANGMDPRWQDTLRHPAWADTGLAPLHAWSLAQSMTDTLPGPTPSPRSRL